MSKASTKATIDANVRINGTQAITGSVLNSVLNTMVDDSATQGDFDEVVAAIAKYENNVKSPDFSNLGDWETDRPNAISVNGGVAKITYDNNKPYLLQRIPYNSGENVFASIEYLRTGGANSNFCSSIVVALYDGNKQLIDTIFSENAVNSIGAWKKVSSYTSANAISEIEAESGKTCAYIGIGSIYIGSYFSQGSISIKNPVLILSEKEGIDNDYIGSTINPCSEAISVKGIKKGLVGKLDLGLSAINYDDASMSFSQVLERVNKNYNCLSIEGNVIKKVNTNSTSSVRFLPSVRMTTKDKFFVAIKMSLSNSNGAVSLLPLGAVSEQLTTPSNSKIITLDGDGEYVVGLYIALDYKYQTGRYAILDNNEYSVFPAMTIDGLQINQTTITINGVRIYKNPSWIDSSDANSLAQWIFDGGETDNVLNVANHSRIAEHAKSADRINGISPLLSGKRLVTIGDSITFQNRWQPLIAEHLGLTYILNSTKGGTGYVNINTGELYDFGLTFNEQLDCFLDTNGVRYGNAEYHGSGIANKYERLDNRANYALSLTPERTNYPKYYIDANGNRYLPNNLAYGGQGMRVMGDSNQSMYEMSFMAKYYNPDIVILTGGTNDSISTYGSAEDEPCELTLAECQGTITNVTVCSAVKGAIKRIMTDCPNAIVFLAMPVRSGQIDSTKPSRLYLMQQYKQIAYDMGVGFIDWNSGISITDYNLAQCFVDGIHPNDHGGFLMARAAIQAILG